MANTGKLVSTFCSFVICFQLVANAAGAPETSGSRNIFQASGECRFKSIRPDGRVAVSTTEQFTVRKSNDIWSIKLVSLSRPGESHEHFFDGTNLFKLHNLSRDSYSRFPGPPIPAQEQPGSIAIISPGVMGVTRGADSLAWFAFLSESTLKGSTNRVCVPWHGPNVERQSCKLGVDWDEKADLPKEVRFIASRKLWEDRLAEIRSPRGQMSPFPYPDGFLAGKFEVTAWTNVSTSGDSIRFPVRFVAENYHPPNLQTANATAERYECEVAQIDLDIPAIRRPELIEDRVQVHDTRPRTADFPEATADYIVRDHTWPEANSEIVRRAWQKSVEVALRNRATWRQEETAQKTSLVRNLTIGAGLLAIVVAVLFWPSKNR